VWTNSWFGRSSLCTLWGVVMVAALVDVETAMFSFSGIKIHRSDGTSMRTLVSGSKGNEPWTPRAERISREIVQLATEARAESPARAAGSGGGPSSGR
jgi:hypothetical protein